MHCPLCHEFLPEGEDLQFHYLLGCSAYTAGREDKDDVDDESSASVRFRWAKVEPCVDRIVHLISSLAGSIPLHWNDLEGLYESSITSVPLGKHSCQLAIQGDLIQVQDFEIEQNTDVMYIIRVPEDESENDMELHESIFDEHDDPVADLLASRSLQDQSDNGVDVPTIEHRNDDNDNDDDDNDANNQISPLGGNHGNPLELSPLYKELLRHQVLHGEPSWMASSGNQSPTSSDQEIEDLIRMAKSEHGPPQLTGQPANPDDRLLKSPIPIKPIEIVELPDENTEQTDGKITEDRADNDERFSASPSTYSGTTSKQSSDHSSHRNSPHSSDPSDDDAALQEQSLEDSSPRHEELPSSYTGTFLTSTIPDNEPTTIAPPNDVSTGEGPSGVEAEVAHNRSSSPRSIQSETRDSPQDLLSSAHDRPASSESNQSETRASPHDRPASSRTNQSETRASPQDHLSRPDDRPSSVRISQSETRISPHDQLPSHFDRPSSARSSQSETRASPLDRPSSARSNQSEIRASPHDRPSSARSNQSETRASPQDLLSSRFDRPPSATSNQSDIRASPHVRPSSTRSNQSEIRASPHDRPSSARSNQSEINASPHDRPSSARSNQSEIRASPHDRPFSARSTQSATPVENRDQLPRRFSGPAGFPMEQERRTPPVTGAHMDGRGRGYSPPFSDELPSPSEPSPSISRHSSARSTPHSTPHGTRILQAQHGFPLEYARESHALQNSSSRRTDLDSMLPSREKYSNRHRANEPGSPQGLMIVGHSLSNQSEETMRNGLDHKHSPRHDKKAHEEFAKELSKRTALYETEIKELKALNEELCQQLLSLEAAASITEREMQKSKGLDRTVSALQQRLTEKENEVNELKKRCADLEKENQVMKDEQESLKTVNKLTYEDLNKVNSDLLAERTDILRRKTYGSPMRTSTDDTVPHIENMNKTLHEKVSRLETEKRELKQKYNNTKIELEKTKAEKSISEFRLTRAKSEADLRDKFDRFTDYKTATDKQLLGVDTNGHRSTSSGLGSSRYTWSDTNVDTAYKIGSHTTPSHALLNGSSSSKDHTRREDFGTSRRLRGTRDDKIVDSRPTYSHSRHRSLSSESSGSSLLEYEYGANIRIPYESTSYASRDKKVVLRETGTGRNRPHADTSKLKSDYLSDYKHHKSTSYNPSLPLDYKPYDYGGSSLNSSFNSESSYGTRDYSKPFLPISTGEIRLGKRVVVMRTRGNVGRGVVRYVGHLPERQGIYVGVELDEPEGRNNGAFNGQQFFKCPHNKGVFVKFDKVIMCCN